MNSNPNPHRRYRVVHKQKPLEKSTNPLQFRSRYSSLSTCVCTLLFTLYAHGTEFDCQQHLRSNEKLLRALAAAIEYPDSTQSIVRVAHDYVFFDLHVKMLKLIATSTAQYPESTAGVARRVRRLPLAVLRKWSSARTTMHARSDSSSSSVRSATPQRHAATTLRLATDSMDAGVATATVAAAAAAAAVSAHAGSRTATTTTAHADRHVEETEVLLLSPARPLFLTNTFDCIAYTTHTLQTQNRARLGDTFVADSVIMCCRVVCGCRQDRRGPVLAHTRRDRHPQDDGVTVPPDGAVNTPRGASCTWEQRLSRHITLRW